MTTVTLASDFIERIRSHHEDREEHEVEGQEDYLALRVIEWVNLLRNAVLMSFTPLRKRGVGGIFRCYPTIADLRPKLAPCGQIRPTPSYTYGTACGENKFLAGNSIGKTPSATTSLIFMHRQQNWSSNSTELSIWSSDKQNTTPNGPGISSSKD